MVFCFLFLFSYSPVTFLLSNKGSKINKADRNNKKINLILLSYVFFNGCGFNLPLFFVVKNEKTNKKYLFSHGSHIPQLRICKYDDGSRKLITINDKCLISNNQCFWKDARDTHVKVKTRTMASSEKVTPLKIINNYFKDKEKDNAII